VNFEDIKSLKTGARELRKFGLLVGGVFTLLGVIWLLRGKPHYPWALVPGVLLIALGAILPRTLKYVYIAWMSVAVVLGFIVSNVLLTLFFFVVITPIGLIARACGKDFLRLKLDRAAATYWIPRARSSKDPSSYDRQF
jgi:hypothetical protein